MVTIVMLLKKKYLTPVYFLLVQICIDLALLLHKGRQEIFQ